MNTKHKKIIIYIVLTLLLALIFAIIASAARNNIALECKIDSFCGETEGASAGMLVDGDREYNTKWQASDGANHKGEPHWIILDFEAEKTFELIRLIKASQGAADFGRTEFDAGGFRFEISSDKKSWVKIIEVTGNGGEDIYESSFEPVTARYLKLSITHPEQDEKSDENQPVRLYDLKVFETKYTGDEDIPEDIFEPEPAVTSTKISPPTYDSPIIYCVFILAAGVLGFAKKHKKYRRD